MSSQINYIDAVENLTQAAHAKIKDQSGRVRVEDLLSSLSAVTGDLVLRAAIPDLESRDIPPGKRVFSTAVNEILFDDVSDWAKVGVTTTFGAIRSVLHGSDPTYWPARVFPEIATVLQFLAHTPVTKELWSWVPLSVPPMNKPLYPPLRAAFELRPIVLGSKQMRDSNPREIVAVGSLSLLKALTATKKIISPDIALTIVFETINGMSKTAPMMPRHMTKVHEDIGFRSAPKR